MSSTRSARPAVRRPRSLVAAGVALVAVALGAAVGSASLAAQPSPPSSRWLVTAAVPPVAGTPRLEAGVSPPRPPERPPRDETDVLGPADGVISGDADIFDDELPAVANLDPALLGALRRAAADAADDGITVRLNSGWRSRAAQEQLVRDAVSEYGSEEEASRWVASPDTSEHVSGDAVDVGPRDAASWLSAHGAAHGLCRIYRNEPWHFELRPDAGAHGCPAPYADAAHDPRMHP